MSGQGDEAGNFFERKRGEEASIVSHYPGTLTTPETCLFVFKLCCLPPVWAPCHIRLEDAWESSIQCRVIRLRNVGLIMIDCVGPCELSVIVFVSDRSSSQVTVADLVQRFLCGDCQTDELRQ